MPVDLIYTFPDHTQGTRYYYYYCNSPQICKSEKNRITRYKYPSVSGTIIMVLWLFMTRLSHRRTQLMIKAIWGSRGSLVSHRCYRQTMCDTLDGVHLSPPIGEQPWTTTMMYVCQYTRYEGFSCWKCASYDKSEKPCVHTVSVSHKLIVPRR